MIKLIEDSKKAPIYFPPRTIKRITQLIFQNLRSPNHSVTFENEVLFWIATHPNTPILILEDIAFNQSDDIYERLGEEQFKRLRAAVACNQATPS